MSASATNSALIDFDPAYVAAEVDFFSKPLPDPRFGAFPELMEFFSFMEAYVLYDHLHYLERQAPGEAEVEHGPGAEFLSRAKMRGILRSVASGGGEFVELVMHARKMWPGMWGYISDDELGQMFQRFLDSQKASEGTSKKRKSPRKPEAAGGSPNLVDVASTWMFSDDGLDAIRIGQGKLQFYLTDGLTPVIDSSTHSFWLRQVAVIAAFADLKGLAYSPSFYNLPVFTSISSRQRPLSVSLYAHVADALASEISALQQGGLTVQMPIPPIPALILSRSNSGEDVYTQMDVLRQEFETFRKKFGQYQSAISNPEDKTLGEIIQVRRDALSEVEGALTETFRHRTDSRVLLETFDSLIKSSVEAQELKVKTSLSLSGLVSLAAKRVKLLFIKGRASSMFDLWKKTLQIKDYHRLVSKTLGYEITPLDMEANKRYVSMIEKELGDTLTPWSAFIAK